MFDATSRELMEASAQASGQLLALLMLAERLAGDQVAADLRSQTETIIERLEGAVSGTCVALYDAQGER